MSSKFIDDITPITTDLFTRVIPGMRKLFKVINPYEYNRWQGNCCRQCAMMTAYVMGLNGYYNSRVIERRLVGKNIRNKPQEEWEHSFNVIHKKGIIMADKGSVMVDLSVRGQAPIIMNSMPWGSNKYEWRKNKKIMSIISSMVISDICYSESKLIADNEYYSNLTLDVIFASINKATLSGPYKPMSS